MLFGIEKGRLDTFLHKYSMKLLYEMDANILEKRFFANSQGRVLGKLNTALAIAHAIK
ncbi:hypothetical protein [Yersinia frederiksenii]|uniref:hypothetical protein n=1 Tax=Yersinia frederiksenii TaxID=29484 RepID=UPI0005E3EA13|nr:hypothetical protein [Yersinia frederiksenii]CNF28989.1 O-methyltransferase involved in polyketide biosynthesis [Yersinia frederiksenii]